MVRMHRRWSIFTLAFEVLLAGCHHRTSSTPEFLRTDDFRYQAGSAVLQWATEYAINVGITLEATADGASARVRILPARGRPPLTL
jgi:hypothetical protein